MSDVYNNMSNSTSPSVTEHSSLPTPGCLPYLGLHSIMAATEELTPRVWFTLDDSEIMRLVKLRSQNKLSHWTRIEADLEMKPDETVAKSITALVTADPMAYDNQYANWSNRYSDFKVSWVKARNEKTNVIEGRLIATGRPRFKNLGKVGLGSQVILMYGPLSNDPLPTTKVGDLRINHLSMEITFDVMTKPPGNESEGTFFKVGHKNKLYGDELRAKNKKAFKEEQDMKKGAFSKKVLTNLLKTMAEVVIDEKNKKEEAEDDTGDISDEDIINQTESPAPFSRSVLGNNSRPDRNSEPSHPGYHQSFRPTPEQNNLLSVVRDNVRPNNGDPGTTLAEGGQPLDVTAGLDKRSIAPEKTNAGDDQVRLES